MALDLIKLTLTSGEAFKVGDRTIELGPKVCEGDLCDFYEASHLTPQGSVVRKDWTWFDLLSEDEEVRVPSLLKIVKSPEDNDLAEQEGKVLSRLFPKDQENAKFYRYLPRVLETFRVQIGKDKARQASVIARIDEHVTLADILKAYPKGIDYRDFVWMWKRTLVGVGFAHENGIVHGAVLPPHVLVHPTGHGAKIIDWSYAVQLGSVATCPFIKAISARHEAYYPPEVFAKSEASPATDIYMIAKCGVALLGGDVRTNSMPDSVPEPIQALLRECLDPNARMRPSNAWDFHTALDKVLFDLVGKPTYRPFSMPLP